jgi:hypothetical protein
MTAKVPLTPARLRKAVRAVHVLPSGAGGAGGWDMLRVGHRPERFTSRDEALAAAKKSAALQKVGVLVHESGRVIQAK